MNEQRFEFLRLPDDLRLKVLQTADPLEIMAYSFISKKAFSIVKALRLPISHVRITMKKKPQIEVKLSLISIKFELNMSENDEKITHLNGFPVTVKVSYSYYEIDGLRGILSAWTNQEKTVGEWIQHLCSYSQPKCCLNKIIHVREIELDIQTLRNVFPVLGNIDLIFCHAESNEHDIMSAQNVLKAFLSDSQYVSLERAPLQDHFSLQRIGMANLKFLFIRSPHNLNVHDLSTLNAETIWIKTDQISLRDLNRFFKLWMKGSNQRLKELAIFWDTEILPGWNVLLKGLQAKTKRNSWKTKLKIKNCRGVCGKIRCEWVDANLLVQFTVS
ncbi:Protein CBG03590 [Caenorhabditis briggsae]|uniref:Protein CBG03590 n=1 Tax=Caenorhabditis briggsae TaxID=6238 RepID=A8WVE6_CAEBR|nr:Protein CBG03590 [Caenorhabditis briggsae]CAP24457.2 Protein CBG03590 [Caenorhabditis briggsae]